jgi:hypothetical protein
MTACEIHAPSRENHTSAHGRQKETRPVASRSWNAGGCSGVVHWLLGLVEDSKSRFLEIQSQTLDKTDYQHGGGGKMLGGGDWRRGGAVTPRL